MRQRYLSILGAGCLAFALAAALSSGCQQQPPSSRNLKSLADKFVEVWNNGNVKDLDGIIDPNFVYHSNLEADIKGLEGLRKVISEFRTAYPDLRIVLDDEVYGDNKAAARWTLTGTNTGPGGIPPTGKQVKIWGISVLEYANGKIASEWVAFDNQAMMQQLGYTAASPSTAAR